MTTVGRLADMLGNTGRAFTYGRLTYIDANDAFDPILSAGEPSLTLRTYFLKRKEYESEQEVRFVTAGAERPMLGGILLKNIDARSWILSIRLWPGLTDEEKDCLVKAIRRSLPDADCQRSQLLSTPGSPSEFIHKVMKDQESAADKAWLNQEDGIPVQLKSV
jgi:hypothetical protein